MRLILVILGILCIVAAVGGDTLPFLIARSSYLWTDGLVMLGFLFFYLASVFGHFARLDSLFKPCNMADADPIKTNVDVFEGLHHVEGQATCAGCGEVAPKRDLCYSQSLDAYYHRACLARDLSWEDQSRGSQNG